MRIAVSAVSTPGGAAANEDYCLASGAWWAVLDGITRYPDDGCVHDVPWYVGRLGAALASRLEDRGLGLHAVLRGAIEAVADRHRGTCDLANPVTPGATVALARVADERIEWLVLGDSAVAWRSADGAVRARSDERVSRLADPPRAEDVGGVRRFPVGYLAEVRNRPGGFWVADADPGAADAALSGSLDAAEVRELMLCTDGVTRLVERFGHRWEALFRTAAEDGVAALVPLVRGEERAAPSGSKPHDDATALFVSLRPDRR
ncbi:MAG TPA: protein phosphatase 2C domain-containing protein [Glycomyces sp.]|nr:protein phosphatase 2C domain-containing protein [Glycomyces sp.]